MDNKPISPPVVFQTLRATCDIHRIIPSGHRHSNCLVYCHGMFFPLESLSLWDRSLPFINTFATPLKQECYRQNFSTCFFSFCYPPARPILMSPTQNTVWNVCKSPLFLRTTTLSFQQRKNRNHSTISMQGIYYYHVPKTATNTIP